MLFQLKKPRVNPNATPRGCPERTFCTLDEHYHTHTHNTKHLYSTRASTTCARHLGNLAWLSDARFRGASKVLMNRIELDH